MLHCSLSSWLDHLKSCVSHSTDINACYAANVITTTSSLTAYIYHHVYTIPFYGGIRASTSVLSSNQDLHSMSQVCSLQAEYAVS